MTSSSDAGKNGPSEFASSAQAQLEVHVLFQTDFLYISAGIRGVCAMYQNGYESKASR
jgi:hypothetical protein